VDSGTGITKLVLEGSEGEKDVAELFAKLKRDITGLKVLEVKGDSWTQEDQLFQNVARVVSRTELYNFGLTRKKKESRSYSRFNGAISGTCISRSTRNVWRQGRLGHW
jgi:hypothetical protein